MHACATCQDLWRRYAVAMKIHIQLENKLRMAALQDGMIESLARETEGADKILTDLRDEISEHERSHSARVAAG